MTDDLSLPTALLSAIRDKTAILFLGAGASKEATNDKGDRPPDAVGLRDILARKFFNKEMPNRDVMAVAEMAAQAANGRPKVFEAVRDVYASFKTSEAHKLVGTFNWRAIVTTNYDLLLEAGYHQTNRRAQALVKFVKDDESIEDRMQAAKNPVAYIKLHGCLENIYDSDIPLVLGRDSYRNFSKNRQRLYSRIRYLASESTIIFVGYRLEDPHIRELIYDISSDKRPRWFMVTPDAESEDIDFWGAKNVGVIKGKFGAFMEALDRAIPQSTRILSFSDAVSDFPIRKFYKTTSTESVDLRESFESDFLYVHTGMPYKDQDARMFYQGYDTGWGFISKRLDVIRKAEDLLIYKAVLEQENAAAISLHVLRGAAGAGKSIALKRSAFEAAVSGALVLWLRDGGALRIDAAEELYELTQRTIFVFVDQVGLHVDKVYEFLRSAKGKGLPIVVIAAEREADWNTYCGKLENAFSPSFFTLGRLSDVEIERLVELLDRHDSLGILSTKTREEQIEEFNKKADRQLLVALHEATQGKPFEEIVLYEYKRLFPEAAQKLYLDIATLHQYAIKVRAGTISRTSGIDFRDFQKSFLSPLKDVVLVTDADKYTGDLAYRTRHSRVAWLVFRQVCSTDKEKAEQICRLLRGLDVGYETDARALEEITRGRTMASTFSAILEGRAVYMAALEVAPKLAYVLQQYAIFEMTHPDGSIAGADELAEQAAAMDPKSKSILHTQAEIDRWRANKETSDLMKESLRRRARGRLEKMPVGDRFAASSRCKLAVDELSDMQDRLSGNPQSAESIAFDEKVKDTDHLLKGALQRFPDDADFSQVEARFHRLMNEHGKALAALERAWKAGPRGSGTALRIADVYAEKGDRNAVFAILEEALERNVDDRSAHLAMALHLLSNAVPNIDRVEAHLRRSFFSGDDNFEARFEYAQFLFLRGKVPDAAQAFDEIDRRAPRTFRKDIPRDYGLITNMLPRYTGTVASVHNRFVFLKSTVYPDNIFGHRSFADPEFFENLEVGDIVSFRLRFNRNGPGAVEISA